MEESLLMKVSQSRRIFGSNISRTHARGFAIPGVLFALTKQCPALFVQCYLNSSAPRGSLPYKSDLGDHRKFEKNPYCGRVAILWAWS